MIFPANWGLVAQLSGAGIKATVAFHRALTGLPCSALAETKPRGHARVHPA